MSVWDYKPPYVFRAGPRALFPIGRRGPTRTAYALNVEGLAKAEGVTATNLIMAVRGREAGGM